MYLNKKQIELQCPLQLLPLQLLPATAIVAQVFADLKMATIAVGTEIQKKLRLRKVEKILFFYKD